MDENNEEEKVNFSFSVFFGGILYYRFFYVLITLAGKRKINDLKVLEEVF